ncbi:hypothetical protein BpHYR1_009580, partial [Brachionus plicatilis]
MKTWKDLLKDNYSLDDLMRNLSEVMQVNRVIFVKFFKEEANERINTKQMKRKIKALRDNLFKNYLNNVNFKQDKIFPRERTSLEMIEDIHVLSCCIVDKTINLNILNLFNGANKEDENFSNEMKKLLDEQYKQISEMVKKENGIILNRIGGMEKHLALISQETEKTAKSNIEEAYSTEKRKRTEEQPAKESESHQKRLKNNQEQEQEIEIQTQNENSNNEKLVHNQGDHQPQYRSQKKSNEKLLKKEKNQQKPHQKTRQQQHPEQKKEEENRYKNALIKKPSNIKIQNMGIDQSTTGSGQTKIMNTNQSKDKNRWETAGNKKKDKTQEHYGYKKKIIGSAVSDVRGLSAASKPISYYTGQWSPKVDPQKVYALVSNFA